MIFIIVLLVFKNFVWFFGVDVVDKFINFGLIGENLFVSILKIKDWVVFIVFFFFF